MHRPSKGTWFSCNSRRRVRQRPPRYHRQPPGATAAAGMGLILDSSVAIARERQGVSVEDLLAAIREFAGPDEIAMSVVSVMELEHGIWRAKEPARMTRRQQFLDDLIASIPVYPITTELARKAGRIDAEQQSKGIRIAFQDLPIGVSALDLGYSVVTHSVRHFQMIPSLVVRQ